jgi:hypothetical protein
MKSGRRKVRRTNLIKMDVLLQDMKHLKIRSWWSFVNNWERVKNSEEY